MIRFLRQKYVCGIIFTIVLILFTTFVIFDAFVIEHVYEPVLNSASNRNSQNITITENSYQDDDISIKITTYREYDTDIHMADIIIKSPDLLKTAFAKNAYGKNVVEKTTKTAENANAILAINGDYYGAREKGYVIRNKTIYRDTPTGNTQIFVIYDNGECAIMNDKDITAETLIKNNARDVFSFGPGLIDNNNIIVDKNTEVDMHMVSNPRTAIGMIDTNHYVFIVSDGRTKTNKGLSLFELATFMKSLSVKTAYNLDGGGSATMVFNNKIINKPTTNGGIIEERKVSDIVYIG